jgi:hypothetical protein
MGTVFQGYVKDSGIGAFIGYDPPTSETMLFAKIRRVMEIRNKLAYIQSRLHFNGFLFQ